MGLGKYPGNLAEDNRTCGEALLLSFFVFSSQKISFNDNKYKF